MVEKKRVVADPITGRGDCRDFRPRKTVFMELPNMRIQVENDIVTSEEIDGYLARLDRVESLISKCLELIQKEKEK